MSTTLTKRSARPIAIWLFIGVAMLIVQILLGGITRLSGSGLSITEWDVVTGALPPMNAHQWALQFEKYRQTPQFHFLNTDFTLKDFKFIFFWEWLHRLWARLMGVVFLVPFIIFIVQRRFQARMIKPLIILFLLGALQGAVGWIMVASGLTGDAIYVQPLKLALHFLFAAVLLCYTFWFAVSVCIADGEKVSDKRTKALSMVTLCLLSIQLFFGALMAGFKAAPAAPTWPSINGELFPAAMNDGKGLQSLFENRITIHFVHRGLAYLILVLVLVLTVRLARLHGSPVFNKNRWWPALFVGCQVLLGILTVVNSVNIASNRWGNFQWLAELHQLVAMFLLLSLVWVLKIIKGRESGA
jgi:cytochrome c oxidase assembly protein subunit 15